MQKRSLISWPFSINILIDSFAIYLFLAVFVGFIFLVNKQWSYTVDDAYITFRYSEHLARGWGLSFNQTPPWTEGYTSFLWVLIMAIPHAIGLSVIPTAKIIAIFFTLASLLVSGVTVYFAEGNMPLRVRLIGAVVTAILFLSFPYVAEHAVSGMETALATFLYAAIIGLSIVAKHRRFVRWLLPFFCLLLGLTRPEANLFCVIFLALTLIYMPRQSWRNFMYGCVVCYIVPGLIYFLWRYSYYGMLFPLPFYIKSGELQLNGLDAAFSFLNNTAFPFIFPVLSYLIIKPAKFLPIFLSTIAISIYLITVNHIMGFGDRFFFPLLPAISVLSGIGIMHLITAIPAKLIVRTNFAILFFLLLTSLFGFVKGYLEADSSIAYANNLNRAHAILGQALATVQWDDADPVLAIGDAGVVPYISKLTTIDIFGLNDSYIAVNFESDRSKYVLSKHPTVIVLISKSSDRFDSKFSHELSLYNSSFSNGYSEKAIFPFGPKYYLWAMWNPDSKNAPMLKSVLSDASKESFALFHETGNN